MQQPSLGKALYELRVQQGITQLELRERSHVSVRTIQRIEGGTVTPRMVTVKILLQALGEDAEAWLTQQQTSRNSYSIPRIPNPLLKDASDLECTNALSIAWVAGIIYLLMVMLEMALGLIEEVQISSKGLAVLLVIVKMTAAGSFFVFTRGLLAMALLFENQLLKTATYISMLFTCSLYLIEASSILYRLDPFASDTIRSIAVVPMGVVSIVLGMGLLRLQDGMGRVARVAGRLEIVFGISYFSLIFVLVGMIVLPALLIVEVVLLSKADHLAKNGQL